MTFEMPITSGCVSDVVVKGKTMKKIFLRATKPLVTS